MRRFLLLTLAVALALALTSTGVVGDDSGACLASCAAEHASCTAACKFGCSCSSEYASCAARCDGERPDELAQTVASTPVADGESFRQCQDSCKGIFDACATKLGCGSDNQECLNICALAQVPCNKACWVTHPPTIKAVAGAVKAVGRQQSSVVGDARSCQAACKSTYSSCASACGPSCNYPGGCPACDAPCEQDLGFCFSHCPQDLEIKAASITPVPTDCDQVYNQCYYECPRPNKDDMNYAPCEQKCMARMNQCYGIPNRPPVKSVVTDAPKPPSAECLQQHQYCLEDCTSTFDECVSHIGHFRQPLCAQEQAQCKLNCETDLTELCPNGLPPLDPHAPYATARATSASARLARRLGRA